MYVLDTLYVEPTNRCNLACTTCPRTFFRHDPLRDITLAELDGLLAEAPAARRLVLHGLGEPLLHADIVEMVRLGTSQGRTVLFNTNGILMTPELARSLVAAGLAEYRVSLDMPDPELYPEIRRGGDLAAAYAGVRMLAEAREAAGSQLPVVSFWMTEGRNRLPHLARLVREAAALDVREVYLQRLILMDRGEAVPENAVFGKNDPELVEALAEAERTAVELGVRLMGSGNVNPATRNGDSAAAGDLERRPWSRCTRPFNTTYVTATGNVLPCCLSPFTAAAGIESCILGNAFEEPLSAIWNGPRYQAFRKAFLSESPPSCCLSCGTVWSI